MKRKIMAVGAGLARLVGVWPVSFCAWFVAAWYFLLKPVQRRHSLELFRAMLPDSPPARHWLVAWRQYQSFTTIFVDHLRLRAGLPLSHRVEGEEHLQAALGQGKGVILLMSHFGNWEVAAHMLKQRGQPLMIYLGERQGEQIEAMQKETMQEARIKLVKLSAGGGSPLDGLEGLKFLRDGGLVSMTGDRLWAGERKIAVRFLGHRLELPAAPHSMALVSGAPLLTFFTVREGGGHYRLVISPPRLVRAASRPQREEAVRQSAASYAVELEAMVRRYPEQWYTFEPFLGPALDQDQAA